MGGVTCWSLSPTSRHRRTVGSDGSPLSLTCCACLLTDSAQGRGDELRMADVRVAQLRGIVLLMASTYYSCIVLPDVTSAIGLLTWILRPVVEEDEDVDKGVT
jgi:hypothetical protein